MPGTPAAFRWEPIGYQVTLTVVAVIIPAIRFFISAPVASTGDGVGAPPST